MILKGCAFTVAALSLFNRAQPQHQHQHRDKHKPSVALTFPFPLPNPTHAQINPSLPNKDTMRCFVALLLLLPALASGFLFPSVPSARARTRLHVGSNAKIDVPPDLVGQLDPSRLVRRRASSLPPPPSPSHLV